METRALNVCRSGPSPEYVEDSEEDEAPVRTREAEYKPGDRLFMTRILLDSTAEDLCATFMTSQKLAEGACQSVKARKEPFILPDYVRGFESVFAKKDFDAIFNPRTIASRRSNLRGGVNVRRPLTHDPGVPPIASQHNFIVQPLVTKEWNTRAF